MSDDEQNSVDLGEYRERLADELEIEAGVTRLARMAAVASIERNLKNEDKANNREIEIHQETLWGEVGKSDDDSDDDGMQVMAARDVYVGNDAQRMLSQNGGTQGNGDDKNADDDKTKPSLWSKLAPFVIGAGSGLAVAALGINGLNRLNPPIDSEYEVRFFDADGNRIQIPHISQRPGD